MRITLLPVTAALLLAGAGSALAEVRYVDVNSTNATPPFSNWTTAATNIQDAVDAAVAGDEIVVANGVYATGGRVAGSDRVGSSRVAVDRPLSLRSVNGPQSTVIFGGGHCVYLTNGASLSGFTLTNGGAPKGGGLWCESTLAIVSNCVIAGNSAYYGTGGGAYQGTLNNCTLSGNSADGPIRGAGGAASGGGAAYCTLNNCTLTRNYAWGEYVGFGGGAAFCALNNCTLTRNYAYGDLFPNLNGQGGGGGCLQSQKLHCLFQLCCAGAELVLLHSELLLHYAGAAQRHRQHHQRTGVREPRREGLPPAPGFTLHRRRD